MLSQKRYSYKITVKIIRWVLPHLLVWRESDVWLDVRTDKWTDVWTDGAACYWVHLLILFSECDETFYECPSQHTAAHFMPALSTYGYCTVFCTNDLRRHLYSYKTYSWKFWEAQGYDPRFQNILSDFKKRKRERNVDGEMPCQRNIDMLSTDVLF